ncbi:MAG: system precrRNA processing endoribonuclease protein Cas6 [Chthonomonadales bacterium]|nr:system precrRNA processing endoribonuclease protein Cas6 [Chthonomonadales bacterium]
MPNAIVISLQRTNAAPLPAAVGECTHGAFYTLIRQADPALSARLHDCPERKPFTLGGVQEERGRRPGPGHPARLRLTFLDDSLFPLFAGALLRGALQDGLRIGQAHFTPTGLLTTVGAHPLAGHATYAELRERAQSIESLALRFDSPTLFRSQGQDVLWPNPRHVWHSWLRAWNAFATQDAPEQTLEEARLLDLTAQITVERYRLETRHVSLAAGGMMGFQGTCAYSLKALSEADRRLFTLLADFAFYAGTGRKTAMGLGQTIRIA